MPKRASGGSNIFCCLLGDHPSTTLRAGLGSTSVEVNLDGTFKRLRYKAWGETRYSSGTHPADFCYTGQKQTLDDGLEWLYDHNAR